MKKIQIKALYTNLEFSGDNIFELLNIKINTLKKKYAFS